MNSKRRSQSPKTTTKSQSKSKVHEKKNSSPATKSNLTKKSELQSPKNIISQLTKKTNNLVKKKIEDLKPPELLIKINYQGKRITIPIATCDDRSLH